MKVLVVEDDPMNAKLFQMILSRKGHYDVSLTIDPTETLDLVRSGDIDLVVMDVSLAEARYAGEEIDGVGLTRLIKQDEATRTIPVLLATAHAMQGDRESFLAQSGAEDYIAKPITDQQEFLDKVGLLLAQSRRSPGV